LTLPWFSRPASDLDPVFFGVKCISALHAAPYLRVNRSTPERIAHQVDEGSSQRHVIPEISFHYAKSPRPKISSASE
jgi:hypothetical protein